MSDGVVRLMCPNLKCRAILAVPATARGRVVRCGSCGSSVRVPTPPSAPIAPAPDAAASAPDAAKGATPPKA